MLPAPNSKQTELAAGEASGAFSSLRYSPQRFAKAKTDLEGE